VIYFNLTEQAVVLLVAAYAKAERANMLPAEIRKVVSHGHQENRR
jgi:hypothetical protein